LFFCDAGDSPGCDTDPRLSGTPPFRDIAIPLDSVSKNDENVAAYAWLQGGKIVTTCSIMLWKALSAHDAR